MASNKLSVSTDFFKLVEEPVTRAPPHLEPHRALLRQWAQDKTLGMIMV